MQNMIMEQSHLMLHSSNHSADTEGGYKESQNLSFGSGSDSSFSFMYDLCNYIMQSKCWGTC